MNKQELVEILEEIAEIDVVAGTEISNHPCSVAVRAINRAFDDMDFLRRVANGKIPKNSKRAQVMLGCPYSPEF